MKDIPVIGNIYYHYDDGKITLSRQEEVVIINIITLDDIEKYPEIYKAWKNEYSSSPVLYPKYPEYFCIGENLTHPSNGDTCYVKTKYGSWYGFCLKDNLFWCNQGLLDVTGKFTDDLIKNSHNELYKLVNN